MFRELKTSGKWTIYLWSCDCQWLANKYQHFSCTLQQKKILKNGMRTVRRVLGVFVKLIFRCTKMWESRPNLLFLNPLGVVAGSKVAQPNSMENTEEEPVHLPCNHSTISGNEYIYWYWQIPLHGPEYIIHGLKGNVTNRMVSLAIHDDRKSSTLILPHASLRDTGVYYCIVRDTH
jgi:hypothetical protein